MIVLLVAALAAVGFVAARRRARARRIGASAAVPMVVSVREQAYGPRRRFKGSGGNL